MENTWSKILQWFAGIAALIGMLFTNMPAVYQVLMVFIILDVITGFLLAFSQKKLSSDAAYFGILKKGGELILVAMAWYLQKTLGMAGVPLPEVLASFYIYVEGLSILTNASALGVPVPQFLKDALEALSPEKQETPKDKPIPLEGN